MNEFQMQAAADIMKAAASGAKIELRSLRARDVDGAWHSSQSPGWNWQDYEYRVKKEPRMLYVVRDKTGVIAHTNNMPQGASTAMEYLNINGFCGPYTLETYQEVVEE
jgi:hypothetical protein